jgi:NAD(P)H-hydrate epimerase
MIEELHIELPQMMENAGRNLADLALRRFSPSTVVVLAGSGGNGGGGLVGARHLANRGATVQVVVSRPRDLAPVPAHQLDILRRVGLDITDAPRPADLVVDALIGYSLRGDPIGRTAELVIWANGEAAPVLALDVPSGLDVTTGRPANPCVHAAATMTLALPKVGLVGAPLASELYLADISVPPHVYRRFGIDVCADNWVDRRVSMSCTRARRPRARCSLRRSAGWPRRCRAIVGSRRGIRRGLP